MKNLIVIALASLIYNNAGAATGDTVTVNAHQGVIINWNGDYTQWAVFPPAGGTYSKIIMKYTFDDPQPGTEWDYTTNVFANIRTGEVDSTLTQYPDFTYNGNTVDSVYFNLDTTYAYFYNSTTMTTDSAPTASVMIQLYADSINPGQVTDSMVVFPANFTNYIYNSSGTVVDSVVVQHDSLWIVNYYDVYTVFEVIEPFELGRVMTPYGSTLGSTWKFDYWFDVTDYAPLLHDSVEMNIHYDGWSNGYAFSVSFYMIEGIPPRTPIRVKNIYPYAYYEYGIASNPIESHLTPVTTYIDSNETNAMMRVIPSGHSFGGALNCAEFCNKSFKLLVDGVQQFSKSIWRSDCGLNPILHQGGTWIFDRSNWCPGSKTLNKDQELTQFLTQGDSLTLEMNMDPYTYTGGAGFNPGYILSAQLFTYGNPNFATDATVEEILKPNADPNYSRFNPICNYPVVVIKNAGSDPLTSLTINYGIEGGIVQTFNWTGFLNFLETETVFLDSMSWGSPSASDDIFMVSLSNPNGLTDQNIWNDTMRSVVTFTPVMPQQFRLNWKTNNAAFETSYQLMDDAGTVIYTNGALSANTVYNDTFNLASGCYKLLISDLGKDGLSFFANSDGNGYARLMATNGTSTVLQPFQADFGTSIEYNFTVGFTTGVEDVAAHESIYIYPNPATDVVHISVAGLGGHAEVSVFNLHGETVKNIYMNSTEGKVSVDISELPAGAYFIRVVAGDNVGINKLLKQ